MQTERYELKILGIDLGTHTGFEESELGDLITSNVEFNTEMHDVFVEGIEHPEWDKSIKFDMIEGFVEFYSAEGKVVATYKIELDSGDTFYICQDHNEDEEDDPEKDPHARNDSEDDAKLHFDPSD